jgi:hypothetical protein
VQSNFFFVLLVVFTWGILADPMPSKSALQLKLWISYTNALQTDVAKAFKCSNTLITLLLQGKRTPGPRLRERIHQKTRSWSDGPISRDGWDLGA